MKNSPNSERITVCVRCRPLASHEMKYKTQCTKVSKSVSSVSIHDPNETKNEKRFTFDKSFPEDSDQEEIFTNVAKGVVVEVLKGYNGTILSYGQSGAGKTYTMEGGTNSLSMGIIPRSFKYIFNHIRQEDKNVKFLIVCSMMQIYKEEAYDLLSKTTKTKLKIREKVCKRNTKNYFYVDGISKHVVHSEEQIKKLLKYGQKNRIVHAMPLSPQSSRSHCIFQIRIDQMQKNIGSVISSSKRIIIKSSKLKLVDLAGSESVKKTEGIRNDETVKINLGLTVLGKVINTLTSKMNGKIVVPYRESRLTKLLMDSLGGNSKTVMIANISPSSYNYGETLSTLKYACRVKSIKNKPEINENQGNALIERYEMEIRRMKKLAEKKRNGIESNIQNELLNEKNLLELKRKKLEERELLLSQMNEKSELEKKILKEKENQIEMERKSIEKKLKNGKLQIKVQMKEHEKLLLKLKNYEANMIEGGKVHKINQIFKRKILQNRCEIEKHKVMEAKLKKLCKTTQKKVEIKTEQLKSLMMKFLQMRSEYKDVLEEIQNERIELAKEIKDLRKDVKRNQIIVKEFIPADEIKKISERMKWNDEEEEFQLENIKLSGSNVRRRMSALNYDRPRVRFSMLDPLSTINSINGGLRKCRKEFKAKETLKFNNDKQ